MQAVQRPQRLRAGGSASKDSVVSRWPITIHEAPFGVNQIAVFANPAQSGFLGPGLVQQWCCVNTGAPAAVGPLLRKPTTDPSEPLIHNPVIVASPSVAGDFEGAGGGLGVESVEEANGEHAVGSVQ